ncbi:hypothetical protein P4H46_14430 [Paenibacillus glucanolyticus]|uniref:hypothetical protein n=1 Tax=Paenibacillus glucanolyticus TaxID=59843 RepID=UPI0030C9EFD3
MGKNSFITNQTDLYFEVQNQGLEQRLQKVKLPENESKEIVVTKTIRTITDKVLGLLPIGEIITTILNWNDEIDQEMNEAKKTLLLEQYFNLTDKHEDTINKLKNMLTNPQGNVLFNKIIRILEDYPPDQELIHHLSTALRHIVLKENFQSLFEQHKFALSQIERLTPQALSILADYNNYPVFELQNSITFGPKVTSDWNSHFVQTYCTKKNITDKDIRNRVSHSITELSTQGFIEAYKTEENWVVCEVTSIGRDILPYLNN